MTSAPATDPGVLAAADFGRLLACLNADGRTVIGPVRRDGAVVLDRIDGPDDLPVGWHDDQEPGRYHLRDDGDGALFGCAVGPTPLRQFLSPPSATVWTATTTPDGVRFESAAPEVPRYAFLGVRACDLAALAARAGVPDPWAESVLAEAVVVGVQCTRSVATCFCASTGTGPRIDDGADIVLTEVLGPDHILVVEPRTPRGAAVVEELPRNPLDDDRRAAADAAVAHAASSQGRTLDLAHARATLAGSLAHPHWDEVADRCLSCGNCTMVCPTCFCVEVVTDTPIGSSTSTTSTRWDSCFTLDFSHLHGVGSVRPDTRSQYRQWLTHKLLTWWDHLDASGCVGCGRCITWCPVGIDLTEVVPHFDGAESP